MKTQTNLDRGIRQVLRSGTFWRCLAIIAVAMLLGYFVAASVLFFPQATGSGLAQRISAQGIWLILLATSLAAATIASWLIALQQGKLLRMLSQPTGRDPVASQLTAGDEFAQLRQSLKERDRDRIERIGRLEEEVQQLRAVLRGMLEGVLVLDGGQQIVFVNEAARRLLNLPAEDCAG